MTKPIINDIVRKAFAPIIDGTSRTDQFGIGLSEENLSGYYPQPQFGTFQNYASAMAKADELNGLLFNLTHDDAMRIVASSMFHGKRRKK